MLKHQYAWMCILWTIFKKVYNSVKTLSSQSLLHLLGASGRKLWRIKPHPNLSLTGLSFAAVDSCPSPLICRILLSFHY